MKESDIMAFSLICPPSRRRPRKRQPDFLILRSRAAGLSKEEACNPNLIPQESAQSRGLWI